MIKDENLRDRLFKKFPKLPDKERHEMCDDHMEHYSIYSRVRKGAYKCWCTRCCKEYTIGNTDSRVFDADTAFPIRHKDKGVCPVCKKPVTYLASGRGRRYIYEDKKFAVFRAAGGNLYISCYDICKRFKDSNTLNFGIFEEHRYCLTPMGAQHWKHDYSLSDNGYWKLGWRAMKSENAADWDYTYINEKAVGKTFLKYAYEAADPAKEPCIYYHLIAYLCLCADRPNMEYLVKTGFGRIVSTKLMSGTYCGVKLNHRSSNIKRVLGLDKREMELLKYKSCEVIAAYQRFKKIEPRMSETERMELARRFSGYCDELLFAVKTAGLSLKKCINYIEKQCESVFNNNLSYTLFDWRDYLKQCRQLEYDLKDTAVSMPKDLAKAHERLTKIIKIKADELAQKELERTNELRKVYEYASLDGKYLILLPKSLDEIVNEGKRLNHCVGGYADRHAKGKLTIMFLRTADKPNVPYYTIEVSNQGRIVQCRGFKNNTANNPKPQEIKDLEAEYQRYLDSIKSNKTRRKTA